MAMDQQQMMELLGGAGGIPHALAGLARGGGGGSERSEVIPQFRQI